MIFDSSIWIHFLKGNNIEKVTLLKDRLKQNEQVFICPPIMQEVLQGIREDPVFEKTKYLMMGLDFLDATNINAALGAVDIYRSLRRKGVTIRKPNDCLIAWYAIHFDLTLVHDDQDFDLIALHTPLKVLATP